MLDRIVPLLSRNCIRCGINSRSDGTFGLSRKKCTLSNVMWMTCWIPCPRLHADNGGVSANDASSDATAAKPATDTTIAANSAMKRIDLGHIPTTSRTKDLRCGMPSAVVGQVTKKRIVANKLLSTTTTNRRRRHGTGGRWDCVGRDPRYGGV